MLIFLTDRCLFPDCHDGWVMAGIYLRSIQLFISWSWPWCALVLIIVFSCFCFVLVLVIKMVLIIVFACFCLVLVFVMKMVLILVYEGEDALARFCNPHSTHVRNLLNLGNYFMVLSYCSIKLLYLLFEYACCWSRDWSLDRCSNLLVILSILTSLILSFGSSPIKSFIINCFHLKSLVVEFNNWCKFVFYCADIH